MAVYACSAGILLCMVGLLSLAVDLTSGKNIICYATNWPQYRPEPGTFHMSDIDPTKCTHLVFAFAKVVGYRLSNYEENDIGPGGQYMQFTSLKQRQPNLKFILGVGGWTHGGEPFSLMAATPAGREQFARNTVAYLRQYNFDGLDVDWEYPEAKDRANLVALAQTLRATFDADSTAGRSPLILAMAVAAGLQNARPGYDVAALSRYVDYFSVMTYDFHGAWENNTGLLAPLRAPPGDELSITISMNWWVSQGAPKSKLYVGMALYGRTWTLARPGETAIGSLAIGKGPAGPYTREPGVLSHYEICPLLRNGFTSVFDPLGQTNYAYGGNEWLTYENRNSLAIKAQYILDNDFAGAMVWSFDQDDFNGEFCGQGRYPLMSVLADRLLNVGPSVNGQPVPQPQQPQQPIPQPQQPQQPKQPQQPQQPVQQQPQQPQQQPQQPQQPYPRPVIPQQQPSQQYPNQQQPYPPQQQFYPPYPQIHQPYPQYQSNLQQQQPPYSQTSGSSQYPGFRPNQPISRQPGQVLYPRPPYMNIPTVSPESIARQAPRTSCSPVPGQTWSNIETPPVLNYKCPAENGKFPDSTSCEFYYFCYFNNYYRERCPAYSHYNPNTQDCECVTTSTYKCPIVA